MLSRTIPKTVQRTRWGSLKRNRIPLTVLEKGGFGMGWMERREGRGQGGAVGPTLINILSDTAAVNVCI